MRPECSAVTVCDHGSIHLRARLFLPLPLSWCISKQLRTLAAILAPLEPNSKDTESLRALSTWRALHLRV